MKQEQSEKKMMCRGDGHAGGDVCVVCEKLGFIVQEKVTLTYRQGRGIGCKVKRVSSKLNTESYI